MAISRQLYNEIMMLDNFTCVYCGTRTPDITIDHYIPQSIGGPDVIANLFACCAVCNSRKGARAAYEMGMAPIYGRFQYIQQRLQQQWLESPQQSQVLILDVYQQAAQIIQQENISIREAARRLDISEATLRRRLNARPIDESDTQAAADVAQAAD